LSAADILGDQGSIKDYANVKRRCKTRECPAQPAAFTTETSRTSPGGPRTVLHSLDRHPPANYEALPTKGLNPTSRTRMKLQSCSNTAIT